MQEPPDATPPSPQVNEGPPLAVLSQMADALPWPMLVLHPDGWLVHANRAARQLLADSRTLTLMQGRRLMASPARLQDKLDEAVAAAVNQGTRSLLQFPGPGSGYMATICRLSADAPGQPVHVLLALAGEDSRVADTRHFAELHGLSPAETRVLVCLARGNSSTHVATELGVTASTVRSQILSLRRKTGHASVTQLLRALNRMPPLGAATEHPLPGGK
jgi:DNA-binding CsgD family transcriptional regulator